AYHLSAILGTNVIGIDVMNTAEAPICYRQYDGVNFPIADYSFDVVLLCYVLHHAQDVSGIAREMRRVLRENDLVVLYEDNPQSWWVRGLCWIHDRRWRSRTGPCTFRQPEVWHALFNCFGFEILGERSLSRWRNLAHPVRRRLYLFRAVT